MTVVTRQRSDRFAIIPNAVAEDARLTFEARGVLCYLLAKPHNWQVQIADIQKAGGIGRDKVYRILNELKAAGYLKVTVRRDEQARIVSHDYVVYDDAVPDQLPFPEKPEVAEPLPDLPDTAEPDTANPDGLIRTKSKTKTHPIAQARDGGRDFDVLWSKWPIDHRPNSLESAAAQYRKLTAAEQMQAVAGVEPFCRAMVLRNKPRHMIPYLRDRRFADFHDNPELDRDGHFVCKPGSPEWSAWLGHIRKKYGERGVSHILRAGQYSDLKRWPENDAQPAFV